jgi:hypothetical protein
MTTKTNEKWTTCTLDNFLASASETEFENLKVRKGTKITDDLDFSNIPGHLLIHPYMFTHTCSPYLRVKEAALPRELGTR